MIIILGQSLISLTGILAGLFFIFSFLGCCCHFGKSYCNNKPFALFRQKHRLIIYLALLFVFIHVCLAMLARFGIWE